MDRRLSGPRLLLLPEFGLAWTALPLVSQLSTMLSTKKQKFRKLDKSLELLSKTKGMLFYILYILLYVSLFLDKVTT